MSSCRLDLYRFGLLTEPGDCNPPITLSVILYLKDTKKGCVKSFV